MSTHVQDILRADIPTAIYWESDPLCDLNYQRIRISLYRKATSTSRSILTNLRASIALYLKKTHIETFQKGCTTQNWPYTNFWINVSGFTESEDKSLFQTWNFLWAEPNVNEQKSLFVFGLPREKFDMWNRPNGGLPFSAKCRAIDFLRSLSIEMCSIKLI